jgi:hypothetical protein
VKLTAHRAGLPGNVVMIAGSAFLPAPAYRQEGGAPAELPTRSKELGVKSLKFVTGAKSLKLRSSERRKLCLK